MRDIYPMHKLCRLFLEDGDKWQAADLKFEAIISQAKHSNNWTDDSIEKERHARTFVGEGKGRPKPKLANDYIKRYCPEHTEKSEAFGSIVHLDPKSQSANELPAKVMTIIEHCLDPKYGYLKEDKDNSQVVYLTAEGRDFASPPYLWTWSGGIPLNIGLINGYLKTIGKSQVLILNITTFVFSLWLAWMLLGANLLQSIHG